MWESDDRLAGDPVWELFQPAQDTRTGPPWPRWAVVAVAVGLGLWLDPAIAVVIVCLSVARDDFLRAYQARRSVPDTSAARVSARFSCGWGLWKMGITAFVLFFATIPLVAAGRRGELPSSSATAIVLWMGGFAASALVTASGLFIAIRNGMRVWVGQGVNQARTLLLTMLVVAFTVAVLVPLMILFTDPGRRPVPVGPPVAGEDLWFTVPFILCMFVVPAALLFLLDAIARRVIADTPTKFGPKVAAVGKWAKPDVSHGSLNSSLKRNA